MNEDPTHLVTNLLAATRQGDEGARERLWRLVYTELHQMAQARLASEQAGRTLQPTALVNEAYLRLVGNSGVEFDNRRHFFAAAGRAMHRICIDDARRRRALKRGGDHRPVDLEGEKLVFDRAPDELLALDQALQRLTEEQPELAELVRLRFFVGLNTDQAAGVLGVSRRTVGNRWRLARAWLYGAMSGGVESTASWSSDGHGE